MFRGLNLWLDSDGGKARDYGIRYPLGMEAMAPGMRRELMRNPRENLGADPPAMEQIPERLLMEFAVMGEKAVGEDFAG